MSKGHQVLPSKVVIRHLPPDMDEEQLLEALSPMPDVRSCLFCVGVSQFKAERRYNRAYLDFLDCIDIEPFARRWDDYVFISGTGGEYHAIVEYAPYCKMPTTRPKTDVKMNTMSADTTYTRYLKRLEDAAAAAVDSPVNLLPEMMLDELVAAGDKEKERRAENTPLVQYLKLNKEGRYETRVRNNAEYSARYQRRRGLASQHRRHEKRQEQHAAAAAAGVTERGDADKKMTIMGRGKNGDAASSGRHDDDKGRRISDNASRNRVRRERRRREAAEPVKRSSRYSRTTDNPESIRESMKELRLGAGRGKDSSPKRGAGSKKRDRPKEPPSRYKDRPTMQLYDPSKRLAERRSKQTGDHP